MHSRKNNNKDTLPRLPIAVSLSQSASPQTTSRRLATEHLPFLSPNASNKSPLLSPRVSSRSLSRCSNATSLSSSPMSQTRGVSVRTHSRAVSLKFDEIVIELPTLETPNVQAEPRPDLAVAASYPPSVPRRAVSRSTYGANRLQNFGSAPACATRFLVPTPPVVPNSRVSQSLASCANHAHLYHRVKIIRGEANLTPETRRCDLASIQAKIAAFRAAKK